MLVVANVPLSILSYNYSAHRNVAINVEFQRFCSLNILYSDKIHEQFACDMIMVRQQPTQKLKRC